MIIEFESNNRQIPLADILYRIEYADHEEIDAMIDALQRRCKRLFPDWDVMFLSLHTGNQTECAQQLERMIRMLKQLYLK